MKLLDSILFFNKHSEWFEDILFRDLTFIRKLNKIIARSIEIQKRNNNRYLISIINIPSQDINNKILTYL